MSFKINDNVVVSNPTEKSELYPNSRSPIWRNKQGIVRGFQGDYVYVEIDGQRLLFSDDEIELVSI